MVACSVEKPKKLSWWPIKRAGIRKWHSSGRKLRRAILMEVGLDLKLMAGRYGCIFSHCERSKAVSGKLNSPMRGGKEKAQLLAIPLPSAKAASRLYR